MPINILYIIDSLTHGGTEKQLVQLINTLDRDRFQPHLCTLKPSEGLYEELDIPKLCLDFESFFSPSMIKVQRRLVGFIKQHNIQIVQTFFQDPFLLAALVKPVTGVKLIGSFRDLGFWRTKSESIKMRLAYRFFDGFIANSQAVKDYVVTADQLKPERIQVIYNGLDPEVLPACETTPSPHLLVGIVANLNRPVKRVEDFVRAAALVAKQQPAARFVVIGGGHLQPELEELAATLGLAERITFTGRIDKPLDHVRKFSVGVITSETEGFCNALVEYMALGVPVVATETGGNPELVEPVKNGYLYPVGNCQQLADHIIHLLNDPQLRQTIADNNQQKIAQDYTLRAMTHKHADYYRQFVASSTLNWSLFTTPEQFNDLRDDWQRLERHSADTDFYLTWDWFYAVTHLAQQPPQQLRLFVARQGGEVVGIVPCMLVDKKWRLCRVRALELLGNLYSPRRGVLVQKGLEQGMAQSFWNCLNNNFKQEWDLIDFIEVSPRDQFVAELHRQSGSARPLAPIHPRVVTSLQEFPTAADLYRSLNSKMRGNIRRRINKLEKQGTMKLWLFCGDHQNAGAAAAAYQTIYQASWKEPEADPTFHARLLENPAIRKKIRIFFLYYDKKTPTPEAFTAEDFYQPDIKRFETSSAPPKDAEPIAALYCLVHQGRAYSLKFAYDEKYQHLAPGSTLICFVLKHLIDVEHCHTFDHQKGDEAYKFDWNGLLVEHTQRLRIINRSSHVAKAEFALTTWARSARDSLIKSNENNQAVKNDEKRPLEQNYRSSAVPNKLRTVVITGADHPTGLGTARALAGQKCHIIGFYQNQTPSTRSKYWNQLIHVPDWEQFIPQLLALGEKLSEKSALFITQDAIVRQISDHREQLEPYFYCPLPGADIVDAFLDKGLFHQWALDHQMPVPRSQICTNRFQLDVFLQQIGYPAIVKPFEKSERWDSYSPVDKAFILNSVEDLARIPFDLFIATDSLVAQQYIKGGDDNVYFCLVYYNQRGECVASFTGRKLFQWPILCGNTAACITDHNPEVESLTRRFFDLAGYQGLGSMEYKRNDVDGRYYMIEPTVGRNDFQSNIAMAGGVNLSAIAFADMLGLPIPSHQVRSAAWISELGLYDAIKTIRRNDNVNYRDLLRLLKFRMGFAHWDWRDPASGKAVIDKRLRRTQRKRAAVIKDFSTPVTIRQFDLEKESPEAIWGLFRAVYGNDKNIRARWEWEFQQHPQRQHIKIYLAETDQQIIGMTVRMPTVLQVNGQRQRAEYATNSMVHPEYRGCGIIRKLYDHASSSGLLQLSKGTMPAMARQLEKMGYKSVKPTMSRVALLSPVNWLGLKLYGKKISGAYKRNDKQPSSYSLVTEYDGFDTILPLGNEYLVTERNGEWMDWRYKQIPHRQYLCFARYLKTQLIGWFVLKTHVHSAELVDLGWNPQHESAAALVAAAFDKARAQGAVKLTYWGTSQRVRRALVLRGGIKRKDGPVLRYRSDDPKWHQIDWEQAHLVLADGDVEYL